MDVITEKSTRIGFGYASHADAFQCGREAAQTAKRQIPDSPIHLVMIFGPSTVHFKDFIEGARLVIGDECLVAIPADRTLSNETTLVNQCFLVAFHAPAVRISIATDEISPIEVNKGTTSLVSQFRRTRGNALREYSQRGTLAFSHHLNKNNDELALTLGADMGIESWLLGASTLPDTFSPLIYKNKTIQQGLLGIEFLSRSPWGVGSVVVDSFTGHSDVITEAVKTALRDASAQIQDMPACFGLIIFSHQNETEDRLPDDILTNTAGKFSHIPLLAISAEQLFARRPQRSITQLKNSVVALLVPA